MSKDKKDKTGQMERKPRLGSHIWYSDYNAKLHPAVVTSVSPTPGQQMVCLTVFVDGGGTKWHKDVLLAKEQGIPHSWLWPK